jgi:membrane fusion protein (multidrug efflux system)
MTKRLIFVLLGLLLLFGAVFGWKMYTGKQMAAMMSAPQPPAVIASAEVQSETRSSALSAVGSLVANQGVFVSNEVAGTVKTIAFESGRQVSEGDLLLQLDDEVDRADLAALVTAQRLAEVTYQRLQKLVKEKTVSQSSYDEAKAAYEGAVALSAAKRASIAKKAIRAPFSGQLGIRQVDIGQYLAPGSQIVSLQALDPIYVDYSLPERHLGEIHEGQIVKVTVEAFPQQVFEGRITAINPRIETGTRSIKIRATLANADTRLKPGMFAEVETQLPAKEGVLTLPERAVVYNPYGNAVFVIEEKEGQLMVTNRQIRTGAVVNGRVEIIEGLNAGDRVVADGHNKLRNGQAVSIDNSAQLNGTPAKP